MRTKYRAVFDKLQNLTNDIKVTHAEIAEILTNNGIPTTAGSLRTKLYKDGYLNDNEMETLERHFRLSYPKTNPNCTCDEQFDIPYLEILPEDAKLSEITSIHVDAELVENQWRRNPDNLRIIPMQGDCLAGYTYPILNRDVLIIDISSNVPTREGIYVYTAHDNSMIFIAKLAQLMDGTMKIEKYERGGEIIEKLVPLEKQKEVDFRVIGRVVKNVSWTL